MTEDPHMIVLSMIEKVDDPQLRVVLSYMAGMIKALELKIDVPVDIE